MKKIILLISLTLFVALTLTACGVPQKEYDKVKSDLAVAQAQIKALETEKMQAENEALKSQLSNTEAQIESLKNQLAQYQSQNPSALESAATELSNIQSAVISMMTDQGLSNLPIGHYSTSATNDMSLFPDPSSVSPKAVLYGFGGNPNINYVTQRYTKGTYTVNAAGTVTQVTTGY